MFYFYTHALHFSPEFIGRVNLLDGLAQLAGVWVFNTHLKHVPLRRLFLGLPIIGAAAGATQLLLVTGVCGRARCGCGVSMVCTSCVSRARTAYARYVLRCV